MTRCGCGEPLHYSDPKIQATVEAMVADLGECTTVATPDGSWRVPRHFIALHGIKAVELPQLAEQYGWERG